VMESYRSVLGAYGHYVQKFVTNSRMIGKIFHLS